MKAVNLIPEEDRRNAGGAAGRSGGAAYVLLGALAVLVAMVSLLAITGGKVSDKRDQLASLQKSATAAEQRADSLKDYTAFASLSRDRVTTVTALAKSRFDWAHVMHEIARTIPKGVTLTSLKGDVSGSAATAGATTTSGTAASGPSVTIGGCAKGDQKATARMLVALRQVDGVQSVQLNSSAKAATAGASSSTTPGTGSAGCAGPAFEVVTQFASQGATP